MPVIRLIGFRAARRHQLKRVSQGIEREIDNKVGPGTKDHIFPQRGQERSSSDFDLIGAGGQVVRQVITARIGEDGGTHFSGGDKDIHHRAHLRRTRSVFDVSCNASDAGCVGRRPR